MTRRRAILTIAAVAIACAAAVSLARRPSRSPGFTLTNETPRLGPYVTSNELRAIAIQARELQLRADALLRETNKIRTK